MNFKSNKGITMISLIVTVIILLILAYATISISINLTGQAKFQNVQTYMLLIQTKCEVLANEKAIGEIDESGYWGERQGQENEKYAGWYKLGQGDLNEIGVKDAKAKDEYYVNYETFDVAYGKGIEHEGVIYYKLSEIKDIGK